MNAAVAQALAKPPEPGKLVSALLAVTVHLLLIAFLLYGIRWQTQMTEAVEVELVRAEPAPTTPVIPQAKPEPHPEPLPKPEPKIEEKPLPPPPKPDIAVKEKPKPPPKEAAKPPSNPFQQQLDQDLKQAASRKVAEMAKAELSQLKAAQAATARNKAVADYIGKIRDKIKGNIVLPPDLKGNPEAIFSVVQLPSGEIISFKLKQSSGHAGYDTAVERAILKSSPLPKPEHGDLFERELNLKFKPLEE